MASKGKVGALEAPRSVGRCISQKRLQRQGSRNLSPEAETARPFKVHPKEDQPGLGLLQPQGQGQGPGVPLRGSLGPSLVVTKWVLSSRPRPHGDNMAARTSCLHWATPPSGKGESVCARAPPGLLPGQAGKKGFGNRTGRADLRRLLAHFSLLKGSPCRARPRRPLFCEANSPWKRVLQFFVTSLGSFQPVV